MRMNLTLTSLALPWISVLALLAMGACGQAARPTASSTVETGWTWERPAFLPGVRSLTETGDVFSLDDGATIFYGERQGPAAASLERHARVLSGELALLTGRSFPVRPLEEASAAETVQGILLRLGELGDAPVLSEEGEHDRYRLVISENQVVVEGDYPNAVACGTSTLLQAIVRRRYFDEDAGSEAEPDDRPQLAFAGLTIEDEPLAAFRSVMIDVARQPHSIEVLEDVIRFARLLRLRYVHLHLTDNQHFTFPFEPVVSKLKGNHAYTRQEMTGLVTYAADRGITLIPEIDLPGHSRRLVESGYLKGAKSDADIASPEHAERLNVLLGDVMDVFHTSPYLHIGGDESGAGSLLVPFLGRVQAFTRARGRRLIVWEGFHGAPTDVLPASGEDRVIVAAWESSYNAPWDLLEAGYQLINASWRPTYVVGGDTRLHPGSSGGRKWDPNEIALWNKDRFMHWEPGRPVFEDLGPGDTDRDDGIWDVPTEAWRDQILGGQMCVWEQRETSVIRDLMLRLPVLAERLWAGSERDISGLERPWARFHASTLGLVQPVRVAADPSVVTCGFEESFVTYTGGETEVYAHSRIPAASLRYTWTPYSGNFTWIDFPEPTVPSPESALFPRSRLEGTAISGGGILAARAFDRNGEVLPGTSYLRLLDWPPRVRVTEFDIGRRPVAEVPDFDALPEEALRRTFTMPCLRGPLEHTRVVGQRHDATFRVRESGRYTIAMKTQSGRASLAVDADGNGVFDDSEWLIRNTPTSEVPQPAEIGLAADRAYALRVDHATALPRPVLIVTLDGPGPLDPEARSTEISPFLDPLPVKPVSDGR